jgi:hypothetical protein
MIWGGGGGEEFPFMGINWRRISERFIEVGSTGVCGVDCCSLDKREGEEK